MNKYLQLFRLGNGIMGIIGILVSVLIATGLNIGDHWFNVIVACFVIVTFIAGGNALNDYVDRFIDKDAHPERPLPSGRMKPKTALILGCSALLVSVLISLLFQDVMAIVIVIIACALMISYELVLKQRGLVGNITIAVLTGMIFMVGGAIAGNIMPVLTLAGLAVIVSIGREIAKDVEDMEGDRGRSTLPMKIGASNASWIASAFMIAGAALSIIPFFTNVFSPLYASIVLADAIFIYAAFVIHKDPHKAQKLCKYGMLLGLIAFILGAFHI